MLKPVLFVIFILCFSAHYTPETVGTNLNKNNFVLSIYFGQLLIFFLSVDFFLHIFPSLIGQNGSACGI